MNMQTVVDSLVTRGFRASHEYPDVVVLDLGNFTTLTGGFANGCIGCDLEVNGEFIDSNEDTSIAFDSDETYAVEFIAYSADLMVANYHATEGKR